MSELALLVEDSRTTRRVVRRMLESLGYAVVEAGSAAEAREWIAGATRIPKVTFVDWGLPDADGVDLIREWRAHPRMRKSALVMLTIRADLEAVQQALAAGADEFVMKPCTLEGLEAKLALLEFPALPGKERGPRAAGERGPRAAGERGPRAAGKPARPWRLLIVDDSAIARRLIELALRERGDVELIGSASNGRSALDRVVRERPDLLILDLEMPEMDGLQLLRALRQAAPEVAVIVFSSHSRRGAEQTVEALRLGARDYLLKPQRMDSVEQSLAYVREQLGLRIEALSPPELSAPVIPAPQGSAVATGPAPELVLIAASTGGPQALSMLLAELPATLPVPVAIVQHLPPDFIPLFAGQLDAASPLTVVVAEDGAKPEAGRAYLAPGGVHLRLRRDELGGLRFVTVAGPRVQGCRPAADELFCSAATVGARILAVVLTGMGTDGCVGARALVDAGAQVLAQDRDSSVIWGMPGAVVRAGLAGDVLPLAAIAKAIRERVHGG